MGDVVCNIAKGRVAEFYNRVKAGDPAASRLYVYVFSGTATDAALKDCATMTDVLSAGLSKLTTNNWNVKTLAAADLVALTTNLDNTNDWFDIDIPDQTWNLVSGTASTRLGLFYAAVSTPADSALIPLTIHAFAYTPSGVNVTAVINSEGIYRAS